MILQEVLDVCDSKSITDGDVLEASGVYNTIKEIIEKRRLNGLTIICFDLLQHKIPAYLGMAITNDKGVVATCEGDLNDSFCMMVGSFLTGEAFWMANPSSICTKSNSLTLALCTVPFSMLGKSEKPNLDTHKESQLSVAVEGSLRKEEVTIFRTPRDFSGIYATTGRIVEQTWETKRFVAPGQ